MVTFQDTEAPRIGENRDFTIILPDETIIITAVDTAVGVTVNGYTQPTVPLNADPVTAKIDMKINTATSGIGTPNSVNIVSGVQGTPHLTNVRIIPTFAYVNDTTYDFNLRVEKYENSQWMAINTSFITVKHLEITYTPNGETVAGTVHYYDAQFDRLSDGNLYNYRYRFIEPQNRIIDYIEGYIEQPTSGDILYTFGMTSPTLSVSLRRNNSTPFYYTGQTPVGEEFYYYAAKADRWKNATVPLIVGAENIIVNTETLSFHTYGIDMTWISHQVLTSSGDLGYLITNGVINKWSWRKPCRINNIFTTVENNMDYTLSSTRNGMLIPNEVGAGSAVLSGTWTYERPTGTSTFPYRFSDFYGYNKNAVIPFEIEIPTAIAVNPTGVQVKLILKSGLKQSNIEGANAMGVNWFGVMIEKDTSVYYKTHGNSVGVGGLILDISDCPLFSTSGTVTIYCMLSSAAIAPWVTSTTNTLYSLNGETEIAYKTITLT
ncbi:MAG: hypothetical protein ACYC2P_08685 [Paludibacteraceae bacterium]